MKTPIINFLDICKTLVNDSSDLNPLIPLCNDNCLQFNYDVNSMDRAGRLIFKLKKNDNKKQLLYYYCNGLVIDINNWSILSIPPMTFNKNPITDYVRDNLKKYDIFKIIDGTIVTIYWCGKKSEWCISSSNGFDVSELCWMGERTYSEIIYDLLDTHSKETVLETGANLINDRLIFKNLNKKYCYSIGLRTHDFHPIQLDPETIWAVQRVNLNTYEIEYHVSLPGLQPQKIEDIELEDIYENNRLALNGAIKCNSKEFNYGYILRSKHPQDTLEYSNILLESNLLKKIKKYIYDIGKTTKYNIHNENRMDFIIINNYLNKIERVNILKIYPQFGDIFVKYDHYIDEIIKCIIEILKIKKTNDNNKLQFPDPIVIISYSLTNYISKFEPLNPLDINTKSVLKDYILNLEYSLLFIRFYNKMIKLELI